jgi:hypothetical protein
LSLLLFIVVVVDRDRDDSASTATAAFVASSIIDAVIDSKTRSFFKNNIFIVPSYFDRVYKIVNGRYGKKMRTFLAWDVVL